MNIYVGNLPYSATEDELRTAFAAFGEVNSVSLITDKYSGQSKGFAFVEMAENSAADAAIKGLNETSMGGATSRSTKRSHAGTGQSGIRAGKTHPRYKPQSRRGERTALDAISPPLAPLKKTGLVVGFPFINCPISH